MKQHLDFVRDYYAQLDNHPQACTQYMFRPIAEHLSLYNHIIEQAVGNIDKPLDEFFMQSQVLKLNEYLDKNFHEFTWACHDTHFHINFRHYLGCPSTCLNEIVECVDRILRDKFRN